MIALWLLGDRILDGEKVVNSYLRTCTIMCMSLVCIDCIALRVGALVYFKNYFSAKIGVKTPTIS